VSGGGTIKTIAGFPTDGTGQFLVLHFTSSTTLDETANINIPNGTQITAGSTYPVYLFYNYATSKWDVFGTLPDVVALSALDLGSATLEIPNGTDPDVTVAGQISQDTDGANVTGDVSGRAFDGTNQFMSWRKMKTIHVTVVKPQDLAGAVRDAFLFWSNETGMTFTVTSIKCWAGTDNTTLNVEETDADGANNATVDALECATNGTAVYTDTQTTITGATIEAGHLLWLDFDDTDDPSFVKLSIEGWFDANVD
jgi:hypothetical protein